MNTRERSLTLSLNYPSFARRLPPGSGRTGAAARGARPAACLLAGLILAALFATPVSAAAAKPAGSLGIRLIQEPGSAGKDSRALLYITDHVAPGATIDRRVEVSNSTDSTARVTMYSSAATIADGQFIGSEGRTANDLSTWTKVTPETLEVPANGKKLADVSIKVPLDAAPGEQYGVIWAEVSSAGAPGAGSVTQVSRVGVRLYLSVGPGGAPAADFTIDSLTADRSPKGFPVVRARVTNTGGRALDMNGTLNLTAGPSGLNAGPFPAQLGNTLAPGDKRDVTIELGKDLPAGPWEAEVTMRSGLIDRTATATLTFPGEGAPLPDSSSGIPAWLLAAGAVLLLLICSLLLVFRRRTARKPASAG